MTIRPGETRHYPAAHYSHVFHGQRVYNANPDDPSNPRGWRVDFHQPHRQALRRGVYDEHLRTTLYGCPPNTFWYPGIPGVNPGVLLQRLGSRLRDQGMLQYCADALLNRLLTIGRDIRVVGHPQLGQRERPLELGSYSAR